MSVGANTREALLKAAERVRVARLRGRPGVLWCCLPDASLDAQASEVLQAFGVPPSAVATTPGELGAALAHALGLDARQPQLWPAAASFASLLGESQAPAATRPDSASLLAAAESWLDPVRREYWSAWVIGDASERLRLLASRLGWREWSQLLPAESWRWTALRIVPGSGSSALVDAIEGHVEACPHVPLLLITEGEAARRALLSSVSDRLRVLCEQDRWSPSALEPQGPGDPSGRRGSLRAVEASAAETHLPAAEHLRVARARTLLARAEACAPTPEPALENEARCASEAVLFALLEAHPKTCGRFRLNPKLALRWPSGRALEPDFLDEERALVLEVDGPWHFSDRDRWRRDREKDWILQHGGYCVLRFWAGDVHDRASEVLGRVLAAEAWREGSEG